MHGNVIQLTDENGKVIKTYEYDSFGNELKPDKNDDNPFRYCGEYYDKETGEIYLRARYYKPSVGRFITRDSYTGEEDEPLSLHLYVYCYNNPVYYVDYMGNKPVKPQPTPKPAMKPSTNPIPQQGPAPPSVPINAYDDQKNVLRVKLYGQEKSVWCGPACLQMIITYKTDIKVSQSKLHNQCTGNEENTVVSIFQIKRAAKNNNVKSSIKFGALSWSGVRKQISQKGPIIAKITWKNGKGHFVVIRGYEFSGGKRYLYINDPLPKGKGKKKK